MMSPEQAMERAQEIKAKASDAFWDGPWNDGPAGTQRVLKVWADALQAAYADAIEDAAQALDEVPLFMRDRESAQDAIRRLMQPEPTNGGTRR
jgi:hypothetical protein